MRLFRRLLLTVLGLYALFLGGVYWLMHQPPMRFASAVAKAPMAMMAVPFPPMWAKARAGSVSVGSMAPDFELSTVDKSAKVRLSSFRGSKPVVLVFGSYTWPPFRREVPELNRIYEAYKDRAAFHIVYIQEAHAADVWQMSSNIQQNVVFLTPKSFDERGEVAEACVRKLNIKIPALLDDFENTTEIAYTGWPDRLYAIDREGKAAFKSGAGPFGFDPKPMEAALRGLLQ